MNSESNTPQSSAIVPVSPETDALVESEMAGESDDVRRETKALIEAIKRRAQSEMQTAGELTRDAYLNAVRRARETIEQKNLISSDNIEKSIHLIQKEAEKNWASIVNEVESLGVRLADAARTAWNHMMREDDHTSNK